VWSVTSGAALMDDAGHPTGALLNVSTKFYRPVAAKQRRDREAKLKVRNRAVVYEYGR